MVDHLLDFVTRIGDWAYLAVFVLATLESAAFVGLLVPGETLMLFAGFLASLDFLDVPELIAAAAAGGVLGDSIGYTLGRRLGRAWLVQHGPRLGLDAGRLARVDRLFARHGGKAVFFGRFVGFLRALAPFVAGASRMPYPRFLFYNAAGALPWAGASVLLGYLVGASWWVAERWIGRAGLVAGVLAVVVLAWLWHRHARR